jgi:ribosomal-protein-alanine N-acetyltransferase
MEQMPYQPPAELRHKVFPQTAHPLPPAPQTLAHADAVTTSDWQACLPVLHGQHVMLRELTLGDAPALLAMLTTAEVTRFISPPPTTIAGFEAFITWTQEQRQAGRYACFAVIPDGMDTAVGLFQVRALEPGFGTAEWGFALGSPFWGRGLFADGARQVLAFAFETIGVERLEARASVENCRGNGALRKVGAVREGTLRQSFLNDGQYHDQHLWALLESDWRADVARQPDAPLLSCRADAVIPSRLETPSTAPALCVLVH